MEEMGSPIGLINEELVRVAVERRARLTKSFAGIARLDAILDRLYLSNQERFRPSTLTLQVLAACYGKARKTVDAIRVLCEAGYGQDAIVVVRSLVNLAINMGYLAAARESDERARDFMAAGRVAHRDFMKQFPRYSEVVETNVDWAKYEERAKRWRKVTIRERAVAASLETMYREHYTFGSSQEHSDAWSLASYWDPSDESTQKVNDTPSDDRVEITLDLAFMTMAQIARIIAEVFQLPEADQLRGLLGSTPP